MPTVKMTSKRQVTFPAEMCEELGIKAGDELRLEKHMVNGEAIWALLPKRLDTSWFGSLRSYAEGKDHDLKSIKASIGKAVAEERFKRP